MNEFEIIKHFFTTQTALRTDVILNIGDDCAVVETPKDHQLAITTDTLISDVHFPKDTAAFDIGYKALAVNLSDLAAMGATPSWFTLALTLPEADETWLQEFCQGMFALAKQHNTQLIGGDLTRSNTLTITIAAYGFLPKNQNLKRASAKAGDLIYITNTLGDAALGLSVLQKKISIPVKHQDSLINRLNRPEPRIEIGKKILPLAHAAIDISDGLAADLKHILTMSDVGAIIYVDQLPLSAALKESVTQEAAIEFALQGGDDYELCFTIPKENSHLLDSTCTCIGVITQEKGLDLRFKDGRQYQSKIDGYQHFS